MGKSIDHAARTGTKDTPLEWTREVKHKYCDKVEIGSPKGKPNKAQQCTECQYIKLRQVKQGNTVTSGRRNMKMGWIRGEQDTFWEKI
ncbi:hypothetical protein QBC38DRAFT_465768 [Podospora fimiseda]|uniref:Uncharacterized protein n=1 Tax=Podospora fimiseda TaxID=252190 RepID=A0AAN7BXH9_9PEZI|nr:hypothetical protein QBC38DRAFT_465768 [Podospora fimiseda]